MNLLRTGSVIALLIACAVSCSHAPRLDRDLRARADIRLDFLKNNPNGRFNEQIRLGEVKKGMSVIEVLASWGLPNLRREWKSDESESWTYFSRDENTEKLVSYELTFRHSALTGWLIDQNVRGLGTLTPRDLLGIPTTGETPAKPPANTSGTGTLKKKP